MRLEEDKAIPLPHPIRQKWACCLQNPTFTAFTEANIWGPPSPGSCCGSRWGSYLLQGGGQKALSQTPHCCLGRCRGPVVAWADQTRCLRPSGRSAGRASISVRPRCLPDLSLGGRHAWYFLLGQDEFQQGTPLDLTLDLANGHIREPDGHSRAPRGWDSGPNDSHAKANSAQPVATRTQNRTWVSMEGRSQAEMDC